MQNWFYVLSIDDIYSKITSLTTTVTQIQMLSVYRLLILGPGRVQVQINSSYQIYKMKEKK
jgi:hypothetical protein